MKTLEDLLAHPIRERVLTEIIEKQPVSAAEVARDTGLPIGTIAYHFRDLAEHGLIQVESTRQRRGATETFYTGPAEHRLEELEAAAQEKKLGVERLLAQVKAIR